MSVKTGRWKYRAIQRHEHVYKDIGQPGSHDKRYGACCYVGQTWMEEFDENNVYTPWISCLPAIYILKSSL